MVSYARIAHHVDKGRGIAARKLGPPYLAFRVTTAAVGNFPDGWTATDGPQGGLSFNLFRRRIADTKVELALPRAALVFEIIGNMEPFLMGDVFLQNDPAYVAGVSYGAGATILPGTQQITAMCLALHQPVGKSVGMRLDRCAAIYRPATSPLAFEDASAYWETTHDNDSPLVLSGGQYSFQPGAAGQQGSLVPVGLTADHRGGEKVFGPRVPGMVAPIRFFVYIPPLPGYAAREGDALITEDGARYVMRSPYVQEAGVVGTQTLCDRKISEATP
jgi:hypothetical protein